MSKIRYAALAAMVLAGVAVAGGQEGPAGQGVQGLMFYKEAPPQEVLLSGPVESVAFDFIGGEAIAGGVVTGAPYSAEATSEMMQTFADGNRIVRKTTSTVFRDSAGRTRREQHLPRGADQEPLQTIVINDPSTGRQVILDPRTRTARTIATRFKISRDAEVKGQAGGGMVWIESGPAVSRAPVWVGRDTAEGGAAAPPPPPPPPPAAVAPPLPPPDGLHVRATPREESLGTQVMEGVLVEGTKTTTVIPAGAIGNELPITIVVERWYSPELKIAVFSRKSDPRFGETTYRLTNIVRADPAASLFEVPADYTIRDAPAPAWRIRQ
jgi:hypothetical protein